MNLKLFPLPHEQTAFTIADDQAVIVLADTGQVTVLNEVATRVWQLADGTHDIAEIINRIIGEFEGDPEVIRQDVEVFIQNLLDIGAIMLADSPTSKE